MKKQGSIRYVFASSYTEEGFQTFIPRLMQGLKKVYILKGAPGSGKSTFIRLLGERMSEQGYEVEFWVSAVDAVSPDGVFIPQLDLAVVNGSLPIPIEPLYPGVRDELIYLGDLWNREEVNRQQGDIVQLIDDMQACRARITERLQAAAQARQGMKDIHAPFIDEFSLQALIGELADQILTNGPKERHYFAEAFTVDGMVNYINELSTGCKRRYIFKGPPGSGKSHVIQAIADQARDKGYYLEYYHCGLQPADVDMLIICDLQVALIEAGDLDLPLRPWDVVVDMNRCLSGSDTEELQMRSNEERRLYEASLVKAQQEMETLSSTVKRIKKIYSSAMDFTQLEKKIEAVIQELNQR